MDPVFDSSAGQKNDIVPAGPANKPLWAAVGVLGVAVAALGGTLLWQNVHGNDSTAAQPLASAAGPAQTLTREDVLSEKTTVAAAAPIAPAPLSAPVAAPRAAQPVVTAPVTVPAAHGNGYTGSYNSQPVVARAPVCGDCGRIESVTPVQHAAPASGIGAVAGGVLGAVLGNQFGHGNGRAATTLLGAGGGAYLGNTVEKRTRTTTTYEVRVHMDNGTTRTFERSAPVPVGEAVTVQGHNFQLGRGQAYSTSDARYQQVSEPQGTYSSSRY